MYRLTIIGAGYVGLVSSACFCKFGHSVTCVDMNLEKIAMLKNGQVPIYEPGLSPLLQEGVQKGQLFFSTDMTAAVRNADAVFIAVGTPPHADTGQADLQYVRAAAKQIGTHMTGYTLVVNKSTVPIGTAKIVADILQQSLCGEASFDVVSNPEFLREGMAIQDFCQPDRIIIGTESAKARAIMGALYKHLADQGYPMMFTEVASAELIKYAANAFLATKIAFINEIADLCEFFDGDINQVADGIGIDKRIGRHFLNAGPGYGGSCLPKDTMALAMTAQEAGHPVRIIESVINANAMRKKAMASKVIMAMGGDVVGKKIGILGVTFKANTDDVRDSPSLDILPILVEAGANLQVYDPVGMENAKKQIADVAWAPDMDSLFKDADAVVILTEWDVFTRLDWANLAKEMKHARIFDLRNLFSPETMLANGFEYHSIGRRSTVQSII